MNDLHLPELVLSRPSLAGGVLCAGAPPIRPAHGMVPPLRLDQALALLRQAGQSDPPGEPGSPSYMQHLIDQLVDLSSRDPLTGLGNRRSFDMALTRELDRVARSGEPALLLMIDIDHFKRVNDTHGHEAGDQVICTVASALAASVRPMDMVARIGGEEFAILLPNCPTTFADNVAARIRLNVARSTVVLASRQALGVTVSMGGAYAPPWVRSSTRAWMQRADLQLYQAKSDGRDRACFEPSLAPEVSASERDLLLGHPPIQDAA